MGPYYLKSLIGWAMQHRVKVLIIDDTPDFHEVYKLVLTANPPFPGAECKFYHTYSGLEGIAKIDQVNPDIVLLDVQMPGLSGIAVCETARKKHVQNGYMAVIFLSSEDSPKEVSMCLDAGGDDFCSKRKAHLELPSRVRCALRIKNMHESILRSNRDLVAANEKLKILSEIDELTGLLNMRSFKTRMAQEFSRSIRHGESLSMIMLDLDHFKQVNDSSNHLMGSFVLSEVGSLIKTAVRKYDVGARFGGDEYVVLLAHTNEEGAWSVAKKIQAVIAGQTYRMDQFEARVTASIGVATFVPKLGNFSDITDVMKAADNNLYRAKAHGRACIFSESRNSEPIVDYSLQDNLRRAWIYRSAS